MIRRLEVIGEAAKKISDEIRNKNPEIPWREIAGLRGVLIHEYFGIKMSRIWRIYKKDLADLRDKIERIKRALENSQDF